LSYKRKLSVGRAYDFRARPMNDTFLASLLAALSLAPAAAVLWHWVRHLRRKRAEMRRAQGLRLIHALGAYSAWIECQRDLPFTARSLDELASPQPLTQARRLKREWFPSLAPYMVGLLQAHSRMIEYLWEQSLLRLSQGAAWRPACEDAQYQQLRGAQEELIEEMIARCRELMGDAGQVWKRTGSDFAFSNGLGRASQGPPSRV
jgi:hypothetical protein